MWRSILGATQAYRPQLRFCLRMTAAGLLAFAIARNLALPLHGLWAVLTAVVVTQASVGGSLRATIEYIVGTIGGAIYAAAVGVLVPHSTALAQAGVLTLAIAPLAFAAAINPIFRVAPFSAVLVLLIGGELGGSPVQSALTRVLEVALGGTVAVAVSMLVLPERAHSLGLEAAARVLKQMAEVLPRLVAGFSQGMSSAELSRLLGDLGRSVTAFQDLVAEAKRERILSLTPAFDPAPLSRTLLRIRHDFVILGRAAGEPLPPAIEGRLSRPLVAVSKGGGEFLLAASAALPQGSSPPPLEPMQTSFEDYENELGLLRKDGLTRGLSTAQVERLFAVGFAFEQLRQNFSDLCRWLREYAEGQDHKALS